MIALFRPSIRASVLAVLAVLTLHAATTPALSADPTYSEVVAGDGHTCAVTSSARLSCWGSGMLGAPGASVSLFPRELVGPSSASGITTGSSEGFNPGHTCFLRGTAPACWGANTYGEVGVESEGPVTTPVPVPNAPELRQISAGEGFTCARTTDATAVCWGSNSDGQLGNGATASTFRPTPVAGLSDVTDIAAGQRSACAVRRSGEVWCWGNNTNGGLGDGTTVDRHSPVKVSGITDADDVDVAGRYACAVRATGRVACWGGNFSGVLGDGTTAHRSTPADVVGIDDARRISTADSHACAVLASGRVGCWGSNTEGQLGRGTRSTIPAWPGYVTGIDEVAAVAAGLSHTCAVRSSGQALCWGAGHGGQLGNGTRDDALTPKPVVSGPSCPDVQVIGVRGSRFLPTDPNPLLGGDATDRQVKSFADTLYTELRARGLMMAEPQWVRYDAALAAWGLLTKGAFGIVPGRLGPYMSSVTGGADGVRREVLATRRRCGDRTQLVLAGWSQGAHAIGRAFDDGMPVEGIAAVALMADPTFNADHAGIAYYEAGPFGQRPRGILAPRVRDFPAGPKVFSFCRPSDPVCSLLQLGSNPLEWPVAHGKYDEPYTVTTGKYWWYEDRTFEAPTTRLANLVARALTPPPRTGIAARAVALNADTATATGMNPVVILPTRYVVRLGESVQVSGALSYSPDGEVLSFAWDLDGDGAYETTSGLRPWVVAPPAGRSLRTISVRATDESGRTGSTSVVIEGSDAAPAPPSAPRDVRVRPDDAGVRVNWKPPEISGGLPILGYVLRDVATDAGLAIVAGDEQEAVLSNLVDTEALRVSVVAVTEARVGEPSAPAGVVSDGPPTAELVPASGGDLTPPAASGVAIDKAVTDLPASSTPPTPRIVRALAAARGSAVRVTVRCGNGRGICRGTAALTLVRWAGRTMKRVNVGRRAIPVRANSERTVMMRLSRVGRAVLQRQGRLRLAVELWDLTGPQAKTVLRRSVSLKRPRGRRPLSG